MHHARHFNPEWGYLAPAPSFMRAVRLVLVAGAVGATAGAAVVFGLADRAGPEDASVAARTLAPQASPMITTATAAPVDAQRPLQPHPSAAAATLAPQRSAASDLGVSSTLQHPPAAAALAEAPPVADSTPEIATAPDTEAAAMPVRPAQKKAIRKHHFAWRDEAARESNGWRDRGFRGPLALLNPYGARANTWPYLWRGEY